MASSAPEVGIDQIPEEFDIWIDTQYFKTKDCNSVESARCPWVHCQDSWDTYVSSRILKQEKFLDRIADQGQKDRIYYQKKRIEHFRSNARAWPLFQTLTNQRRAWQKVVVQHTKELEREIYKDEDNPNRGRHLRTLRRLENYLNIVLDNTSAPNQVDDTQAIEKKDDFKYILDGVNARVMYFKKNGSNFSGTTRKKEHRPGEPPAEEESSEKWPDQRIPLFDLLEGGKDSELAQPCPAGHIRYFHIPSNNMQWIEQAISVYYADNKSKVSRLLSREFWHGQMHGPSGTKNKGPSILTQKGAYRRHEIKQSIPIHARHMRSKCSAIPRGHGKNDTQEMKSSRDFAIFLPYLHWETSSRQTKMASIVEEVRHSPNPARNPITDEDRRAWDPMRVVLDKIQVKVERKPWKTHLARYLMAVAYVADCEQDDRLLRTYIHADPPLHVRRTLDQYYFLAQDSTSARDRDQVVYRGTKPIKPQPLETRISADKLPQGIRRLVMVDQLWLWILDDNTIITAFPRRWGRIRKDSSGVHNSLRDRLKSGTDDITSIYHLAMIIIDQCSRVFFDRTKPLDRRPEVMDLFAAAIGNVTNRTAIAYEVFWWYVHLSNMSPTSSSSNESYHKRLQINPEGRLSEEAQDISEELDIMSRIFHEQLQVVKDFMRYLEPFGIGHYSEQGIRSDGQETATSAAAFLRNYVGDIFASSKAENGQSRDAKHQAEILLELISSRGAEIRDLKDSIDRTSHRIQGLLTLKQQQASIVEAKAALQRSKESVKQGRSIVAFTVVTILFLPLGFFATFFGMNNIEINESMWMHLSEQIAWMFGLSTVVVAVTISVAFSAWIRSLLKIVFHAPLVAFLEYKGIRDWWNLAPVNTKGLKKYKNWLYEEASKHRESRREEKRTREPKTNQAGSSGGPMPPATADDGRKAGISTLRSRLFGDRAGQRGHRSMNGDIEMNITTPQTRAR